MSYWFNDISVVLFLDSCCSVPGGRVGGNCCFAGLLPEALHAVTWKGMGCALFALGFLCGQMEEQGAPKKSHQRQICSLFEQGGPG